METIPWMAETGERYRRGGLAGRLPAPHRPALVVVDLQRGFTDPRFAPGADISAAVEATRRLLDAARERGLAVFFTVIAFTPEQQRDSVWLAKMPAMRELAAGSEAAELDPRMGRREHEPVIVKQAASAFFGTDLQSRLAAAGADSLLVCGATTSGCVRATVVDACSHNWPTFVPREAVGDRAAGPHEASLFDIDAKYADVLAADAAAELVRGSR